MNTTLLIDGNWLLISRLFAVKPFFNVQNDEAEKLKGTAELEDLMCRSICLMINRFEGVINNIVLVADGGSWRKDVKKPSFFDEVYKGNRIKDPDLDWHYIYKALEDIVEKAKEIGITSCRAGGVEGDDWIHHWSRKLNHQGTSCIIWSSDCDLKQLLQVENGAFTGWLNEQQRGGLPGLFLPKELDTKPIDDIEMFMQIDNNSQTVNELCARVNAVTYFDPQDVVEEKVICGDKGDNIKAVIRVERGSKVYRITEKEWHKVKDMLCISTLDEFFDRKDEICEAVSSIKKYRKDGIILSHVKEMFDYNKQLVWLNKSVTPEHIQAKMDEIEYKKYDLSYIKSNYKILVKLEKQESNVEEIFEEVINDMPF